MNKKGFTLIELLVVIAIIGLLSTMAVVAMNNARQKSRDAKRLADVKQMQTALELYYNDYNGYPPLATAGNITGSTAGYTNFQTYMSSPPTPPQPAESNCGTYVAYYTYTGSATTYTLGYCLGATTGSVTFGSHTATPAGIQ